MLVPRCLMSSSSHDVDEGFYKVTKVPMFNEDNENPSDHRTVEKLKQGDFIKGDIIDHTVDLTKARPGDVIEVPYEVTISHSFRDFWQSAFYSYDRIHTSTPFARSLGLQDQVVPFNFMMFLAASMSHADSAKLQVGFGKGIYHWPCFAGDTLKKKFIIRSLRTTSDNQHSVFKIHCELVNQRDVVVFSCEKTMMFPFVVPPSDIVVPPSEVDHGNDYLAHLIRQVEVLQERGSHTLTSLRPGQLLLHTLTRPLSSTHMMQLASLARLTHEKHFNTKVYRKDELLIPGGVVLGLTTSISTRDLHEVLHQELLDCSFPNNLSPDDPVGAITFTQALEEHVSGDIEAITVRTIGIKNFDVHRSLKDKELPIELFLTPLHALRPSAVEDILRKNCPELCRKIVCIADRKIYRQAPKQVPFLL